ncbi:hypothetical protein HAX54_001334 [Datura stramonium]|uniref:Uncharacterized protein n=1 Tax=Datura stramonium TaxID=4076 RepID=A0ABS8RUS6_DATST|nr:hypothetical protein [Datura stramonium]
MGWASGSSDFQHGTRQPYRGNKARPHQRSYGDQQPAFTDRITCKKPRTEPLSYAKEVWVSDIRQLEKQLTMNWECHKVIRTGSQFGLGSRKFSNGDAKHNTGERVLDGFVLIIIIIGCLQVNDDDGEENYAVQVITNENGRITSPSAKPVVRSFRDVFLDFRHDAVPLCSGPHLFSSYLDQQYVFLLCLYVYDRFSASGFN